MKNDLYAIAVIAICLMIMTKLFVFPMTSPVKPSALVSLYKSPIENQRAS